MPLDDALPELQEKGGIDSAIEFREWRRFGGFFGRERCDIGYDANPGTSDACWGRNANRQARRNKHEFSWSCGLFTRTGKRAECQ
jgi:hypothetical protein